MADHFFSDTLSTLGFEVDEDLIQDQIDSLRACVNNQMSIKDTVDHLTSFVSASPTSDDLNGRINSLWGLLNTTAVNLPASQPTIISILQHIRTLPPIIKLEDDGEEDDSEEDDGLENEDDGLENEDDDSVENEKDHGVENEDGHSLEIEDDHGLENEKVHGLENEKVHGLENEDGHSLEIEDDHGLEYDEIWKELDNFANEWSDDCNHYAVEASFKLSSDISKRLEQIDRWVNACAYTARLEATGDDYIGSFDARLDFATFTILDALETKQSEAGNPEPGSVEAAAQLFIYAADRLFKRCKENKRGDIGSVEKAETIWHGDETFSVERWTFWKARWGAIAEGNGDNAKAKLGQEVLAAMDKVDGGIARR